MSSPKYHQVYLALRERLQEGCFSEGVPGEFALMAQFAVARVTIRRALERLSSEGLIVRNPGRRTCVLPRPIGGEVRRDQRVENARLSGLLGNVAPVSARTSINVIDVGTITASTKVAEALQLQLGDPVQKAVRVRFTKEGPLCHITTYVPDIIARQFGRRELSKKSLLVLLEESGIKLGRAHQTISVRIANSELSEHLHVPAGSGLLAVRRLDFDENDRPVQWLHGLYHPDRYAYEMQLSRLGSIDARVWLDEDASAQFI